MAACCSHERDSKSGIPKVISRQPDGKTCSGTLSMDKAEAFCNAHDAGLCNITELRLACGTGCSYDDKLTWTLTPSRGCTDYPLSESACELQLRTSDKCTFRRAGTLKDGHCARTCGLCTNRLDDWAVQQCRDDCDNVQKAANDKEADKYKLDIVACKVGCSYFVRGPPSVYTGPAGTSFEFGTTRDFPPGPTDYWVGARGCSGA